MMREGNSAPQETKLEDVAGWFTAHFKRRKPLAAITLASIAGKIDWIARNPPQPRKEPVNLLGKYARLFHQHLPTAISHQEELAKAEDRSIGERSVHHWLFVTELNDLRETIERFMPILDPPRPKRQAWHLQAAWIEDVILSSFALHEGSAKFSRASDRPLPAMIAAILAHIGAGQHSPGAIADALANVPRKERLVVIGGVRTVPKK